MTTNAAEEVGLILVHGIGEQKRFQHLDGHIRGIIRGLQWSGATVSVEIMGSHAAAFQAVQDTWRAGPNAALRLVVRYGKRGDGETVEHRTVHINVHEVWWADVNETYSVGKQLRFWPWGLSVWLYPRYRRSTLPTQGRMWAPATTGRSFRIWMRCRLFFVCWFFLLSSLTAGVFFIVLRRLLLIEAPDVVKTFTNYLSSVKLYNQRHRGTGFAGQGADFLDTMSQPPRVSIRRRMIRTIADVALQPYSRWYILAHSQGSVVAFNGLMEPAAGWPGFLDAERWEQLKTRGLAGPAQGVVDEPEVPPRPLWVDPGHIAYRNKIFCGFRGLLTYGSPLEKFAGIWPALVAVCREPGFHPHTKWLNVYDPIDPISGLMRSWPRAPTCCPSPVNIGYASSRWLFFGHIKYLDCPAPPKGAPATPPGRLADTLAPWLLENDCDPLSNACSGRFFPAKGWRAAGRSLAAWLQWAALFALASVAAAWLVPDWIADGLEWVGSWRWPERFRDAFCLVQSWLGIPAARLAWGNAVMADLACKATAASASLRGLHDRQPLLCVLGFSALLTVLAGAASRLLRWRSIGDQATEDRQFAQVASPDPPA